MTAPDADTRGLSRRLAGVRSRGYAGTARTSRNADMAKLVDARDLKSLGAIHAGSTPAVRTITLEPAPPWMLDDNCICSSFVQFCGVGVVRG